MSEEKEVAVKESTKAVSVSGIYRELSPLVNAMEAAKRSANVLAPMVSPDFIPPLHAVSLRVVRIDPREGQGDTYSPQGAKQGERALTKVGLDKIAAAAGISWDPVVSGRLDDGSNPHYCRFRAVGSFVDFDGTRRIISGEKEFDLRDGSATAERCKTENELRGYREHIQSHAESKARNRAIRSAFGLRQKYDAESLRKPFLIPKLVFTGETDDPRLREMVAAKLVERSLGAVEQLYGPAPTRSEALTIEHLPPPPVGETDDDDDDEHIDHETGEVTTTAGAAKLPY